MNKSFILLLVFVIALTSCRNDFDFEPSSGGLEFSRDTVYLDTVFTNIGSSTYTLKVYNRSSKDIRIPTIQLGKGLNSNYRMMIDGMEGNNGKIFNNVELLAKDSMFVFIETTVDVADANPTDFLYTDQILFDVGTNQQTVELVTLIQDAYFLYPQRFENGSTEELTIGEENYYGFYLDENDPVNGNEYIFGADKPYVIYGLAAVASGKTLTIEPGARVHFHDSSGIIVAENASIHAQGQPSSTEGLENEIIFEGDRLEPGFANFPGQWFGIWLTSGSTGNLFDHVTIKNGTIGIYAQDTDAIIDNSQLYNNSLYGVYAQNCTISGKNVVINSAGIASLACTYGGTYNFTHSTFNNNWQSSRQLAVYISNYIEDVGALPLHEATFNNCIIYGSNQVEMLLDKDPSQPFNYQFNSCLLKFNNTNNQFTNNPLYLFDSDPEHYNNIIRNQSPRFLNVAGNQLYIENEPSGAFQQGNPIFVPTAPTDITGLQRSTTAPDIGAYVARIFL
ncbi:MAG: hypothetical protein ITG00_12180 [Flavobacterium sp.]|nr:hypothetical protein [Flavobacterium sp.]